MYFLLQHKEPYLSWADFQQTRDSGWNRPFFTYILLVVCTIVLFVSYALNGWKVEPLSVNPMIGPSAGKSFAQLNFVNYCFIISPTNTNNRVQKH